MALGFAGYLGGFGAFVVVAIVGLASLVVGYLMHRDIHVGDHLRTRGGRRWETFDRGTRRSGFALGSRTERRTQARVR